MDQGEKSRLARDRLGGKSGGDRITDWRREPRSAMTLKNWRYDRENRETLRDPELKVRKGVDSKLREKGKKEKSGIARSDAGKSAKESESSLFRSRN